MTDPFSPLPPDDPAAGPGPEPEPSPPERTPEPTAPADKIDVVVALSYGWRAFLDNVKPMLLVVAAPIVAQLVLAVAGRLLFDSIARWFLFQIVTIVVSAIAGIGVVRLALMITGGEEPSVAGAFRYERWGAWIAFSFVFGTLAGIGFVLCIIPGALFLAYFGLAPYFFLDQQLGVGAALAASRQAVTGNGLAFAVLMALVVGALGVVLFFVGVFVTQAVAALALAFLYRHVTGPGRPDNGVTDAPVAA